MRTVLRIGGNEITHKLVSIEEGVGHYLTKADYDKFLDLDVTDVRNYYDGTAEFEYDEMATTIGALVTGELSLDVLRLRLFINKYGQREIFKVTPD